MREVCVYACICLRVLVAHKRTETYAILPMHIELKCVEYIWRMNETTTNQTNHRQQKKKKRSNNNNTLTLAQRSSIGWRSNTHISTPCMYGKHSNVFLHTDTTSSRILEQLANVSTQSPHTSLNSVLLLYCLCFVLLVQSWNTWKKERSVTNARNRKNRELRKVQNFILCRL